MHIKNVLVLSWEEVRALVVSALVSRGKLEVADPESIEVESKAYGLTLQIGSVQQDPVDVVSQVDAQRQGYSGFVHLGCDPVPVYWLERLFFCMSLLSRATDRNGELYIPATTGNSLCGPFSHAEMVVQYLTAGLSEKFENLADPIDECVEISKLALQIGVSSLPALVPYGDKFADYLQGEGKVDVEKDKGTL